MASASEKLLLRLTQDPEDQEDILADTEISILQELYDILVTNAENFGLKIVKKQAPEKRILCREIIRIIDLVTERLTENDHGVDESKKFFEATAGDDSKGNSTRSYRIGRDNNEPTDVADWQDAIPDQTREYVTLSGLLQSLGLGTIKEHSAQFKDKITYLLLTSDHRFLTLDDGHVARADQVFFWANSHGSGKKSYYCDRQSGNMLLAELGIYPTLPAEKDHWLTARSMNDLLGRKTYGSVTQEVQDLLLETLKQREIDVGSTKRNPADMISLYRSASAANVSGGKGYSVYCDPAIEPYLREHLACNVTNDKKHWLNIGEALQKLHVRQDFNNRYTLTEILKELHHSNANITYISGSSSTTHRTRQCLSRFAQKGGEVWMLDPDIIGPVITADNIHNKKTEILSDDKKRAALEKEYETKRRKTDDSSTAMQNPQAFGQMLEDFIADGGKDLMKLLQKYQSDCALNNAAFARALGVSESTWLNWREEPVHQFLPKTLEDISLRLELTPKQNRMLRYLGSDTAESYCTVQDIVNDTKKQLKDVGWQAHDKRAEIAGAFFKRLIAYCPNEWVAEHADTTVVSLRSWCKVMKPEKAVLAKADVIANDPKLVPDPQLSKQVGDLLLGLSERKTPFKLLRSFEKGEVTLGEMLLRHEV